MASPLTIQPDAAAGNDTYLYAEAATTNYGAAADFYTGNGGSNAGVDQFGRALIYFGISAIPAGATITAVTLSLWESDAAGAYSAAVELRRLLRNWGEAQATWGISTTGTNWGTAGCGDATDRVATVSASLTMDGTAAAGFVNWSGAGLVADVQGWLDGTFTNYGWLLSCPSKEVRGSIRYNDFRSSDYTADAAQRPKLVITYTEAGGGTVPVNLLRTHILAQGVV